LSWKENTLEKPTIMRYLTVWGLAEYIKNHPAGNDSDEY